MNFSIGIVGLGRVGRSLLRTNFAQNPNGRYQISIICDVMPISQLAYLIRHDSNYGRPPFTVDVDGEYLLINGHKIRYLQVDRRLGFDDDYQHAVLKESKVDILVNATGTARIEQLEALLDQQVCKKILCSWNISGCDLSIVYGVNEQAYDTHKHHIISASTCTGNAMSPLAFILNNHFGIDHARVITIHPVLSDQQILDGFHRQAHLGRSVGCSIIPTSTNVGASTSLVIPELDGKLDSFSYRVPTEIVSVMDVTAVLSKQTTIEACRELFEHYANHEMKGILHCDSGAWGHEKVSIDFIDTTFSLIILMNHLSLQNGRQLGISVMHDNERGYCCRALDVLGHVGNLL